MPDDCFELEVLRHFRDTYLMHSTERRRDVEYYYQVAPKIVAAIDCSPHARRVYDELYERMVRPCVEAVLAGQMQRAFDICERTVRELEARFLS